MRVVITFGDEEEVWNNCFIGFGEDDELLVLSHAIWEGEDSMHAECESSYLNWDKVEVYHIDEDTDDDIEQLHTTHSPLRSNDA